MPASTVPNEEKDASCLALPASALATSLLGEAASKESHSDGVAPSGWKSSWRVFQVSQTTARDGSPSFLLGSGVSRLPSTAGQFSAMKVRQDSSSKNGWLSTSAT